MVLSELAAEVGVEYRTLHNWVRRYNVPCEKVGKQKLVILKPEGIRILRALAANPPFKLKPKPTHSANQN